MTSQPAVAATAPAAPADHPGRWLGGLIGALISGVVTVIGLQMDPEVSGGWLGVAPNDLSEIGLFGMPVGFVIGRALLPAARGGDWGTALGVGAGAGFVAPPLGAVLILVAGLGDRSIDPSAAFALPLLLVYAIPFSYIAIVATLPAGLVWAIAVALLPDGLLRAARMPWPISRLGLRHAILLGVLMAVGAMAAPFVRDATDEFSCLDLDGQGVERLAWLPGETGFAALLGDESGWPRRVARVGLDGSVTVVREPDRFIDGVLALAPDGTIAWLERPPDDPAYTMMEVWSQAPGAEARPLGWLEVDQVAGLAWWQDGWVLRDQRGIARLGRTRTDGSLETSLIAPAEPVSWWSGDLSASRDGRLLGWLAVRPNGLGATFTVLGGPSVVEVPLPEEVTAAAITAGGGAIVYEPQPNAATVYRAIDFDVGTLDEVLTGTDWRQPIVAADGRIAARSTNRLTGRGQNQVCLTAPGVAPVATR